MHRFFPLPVRLHKVLSEEWQALTYWGSRMGSKRSLTQPRAEYLILDDSLLSLFINNYAVAI